MAAAALLLKPSPGVRIPLRCGVPRRLREGEILSRALPIGSVEVSGDELMVLGRGRGLSAGYPIVGVITGPSMDLLAQAPPGERLRFAATTPAEARWQRVRQAQAVTETRHRMGRILGAAPAT